MPDLMHPLMLNGVMHEFRCRAPLARLAIRALGPEFDFEGALASGAADLVISNWPTQPPHLRISVLFEDQFVCLVDAAHPFTRQPPTRDEYLAANHVAPSDYGIRQRGVVETYLSVQRLTRDRRVVTSYFFMVPYLLPDTDLILTVTRHYAEHFVDILPVKIIECPIEYLVIQFYQLWHERSQHAQTHRWLRTLVGEIRKLRMHAAVRKSS
jgi:DNA-binding transcriptional LysR family regulator